MPSTPLPAAIDNRPRTAVLLQWVGMGDLVWHVSYFRRVAETSRGGRVALIASPTVFARQLVGHEPWVQEIIDFDRHPRRHEGRQGRHRGVLGLWRMGVELRERRFDRIVLFTNHTNRSLVALGARIPERLGYGTTWLQRRLLSHGPWIRRYAGPAVGAYEDATMFAIAQGWCDAPIAPSLVVRPEALQRVKQRLQGLPQPMHALCIGSSEPYKQWGSDNFAALATAIASAGHGVLLIAGPAERDMAQAILQRVEPALRPRILAVTDGTVAETVAAMSLMKTCLGNDTGGVQIAAAVGTPTWVMLGSRPVLNHDPRTLHNLTARNLADIKPADVARIALAA
ncbi:glycosyltransferase family 9 protein [Pelomonas aquatica]|uniref:Lipopolysaccharide heptosyltransferase family protein n=1 Tax=Pelomonas aquatica TaxID=431058 RepID=A0A9X4R4X6_9BURK|nr:glycosyltransferase family 9 protein [Pelomonas aquatica]MCY4755925.1 lipopolysaccharide heptosyltransferase family protein [Pelomonas aquatica]MDG0862976.1 lipopolysaccharide heptosyltransferase family protein [Pelomonas aquatica]